MTKEQISEVFEKHKLYCGRMISGSKRSPEGHFCVWNANLVIKSVGKIWFGDLNIMKDGKNLKKIAAEIGETLYILHESDARFGTENDPVEVLISRAVWNTTKEQI